MDASYHGSCDQVTRCRLRQNECKLHIYHWTNTYTTTIPAGFSVNLSKAQNSLHAENTFSDWGFSNEDLLDNNSNDSIDSLDILQYHDAYTDFGFDSDIDSVPTTSPIKMKKIPRQSTPWKARHKALTPLYPFCNLWSLYQMNSE